MVVSLCDWCQKHGDGKKWYLNVKNYSKNLLKDEAVVESAKNFYQNTESMTGMGPSMVEGALDLRDDEEFSQMSDTLRDMIGRLSPHRGQVVSMEDVRKIIELAGPMAKIACVCRRMFRGNFDEKTCIPVGPVYLEYAKEWPDFTRGGIDYISKEEALEMMESFDRVGYVHTFWMDMHSPAVMGFCNCEFPTCGALRCRRYLGDWFNFFLRKGEYVATLDQDECTGCGNCASQCQFSSITLSPYLEKAIINMKKCAGCGLCRNACEQDAIELVPRSEVPAVRELW